MHYHRNAKTNVNQRQAIKDSQEVTRQLAEKYGISHVTAAKWKKSGHLTDASHTPKVIHYAVPKEFWELIKRVRESAKLTLDDLVEALLPYIPSVNHSNCYRILKFYHLNRLTEEEQRQLRKFATYPPGFLHIDCFYLPRIKGIRWYVYLAVDRATKLVFIRAYPKKDKIAAADFLVSALAFYPFRIHRVLTDNGKEFANVGVKGFGRIGKAKVPFELVCELAGISYKRTKAYHPWTNGMAERMVRTVKEHTVHLEVYESLEAMIVSVLNFQHIHNFQRRLKALDHKTPYQTTMDWYLKERKLFIRNPNELLTIRGNFTVT